MLKELLAITIEHNASDLHISSGVAPLIRIDGELKFLDYPPLAASLVKDILYSIMDTRQCDMLHAKAEVDFIYIAESQVRLRVNAYNQDRGPSLALRIIPSKVPTLKQLALPEIVKNLSDLPNGLILITGPTGCGKSTTLAAMLGHINDTKSCHIVTIEDPIEFCHVCNKSLITQREVYRDTMDFSAALRASLREDPNVILVGELRDTETMRLALTAAETGHLVLATLHTISAAKTIDRVISMFPVDEQQLARAMLAESLRAVIAQVLWKKPHGGRVAVLEVMIATPAIRNLIRDNKVAQIQLAIQTGKTHGMQTLEQHIEQLQKAGIIASSY